ncbi:MAG: phosphate/phosphite/phosphonate ABC transporter substrate-binding protein [Gammaproteobacteria bacterium]
MSSLVMANNASDTSPLRVGMLPSLSLQKLFYRFKPLQTYLSRAMHRPVLLLTASDFGTYMYRASKYKYDLYFAAPHMAALAEKDSGYRRVSMFTRDLSGYLIVRRDGKIKKINDLKGGTVSVPEPLAIVTMMGENMLEQHHLVPGKDIKIDYSTTHNNAILALITGKADAAIVSSGIFDIAKPSIRNKLEILARTSSVSHLMFMASPKLPEQEYQKLKQAMLKFTADGPGKEFFRRAPYGDMTEIQDSNMQNMQRYIRKLKQRLPWAK